MDVTAAESAEVTSVVEERLPETASGMAEETVIEACDWAAARQPANLFCTLITGWYQTTSGLPGGRFARSLKNSAKAAEVISGLLAYRFCDPDCRRNLLVTPFHTMK